MAKLALCINSFDAPLDVKIGYTENFPRLISIDPSFFNTHVRLEDRATCETDEKLLQLLPYIMLVTPDNHAFTYTRGGSGEEARLHGNYSVGVGGHVDDLPEAFVSLLEYLKEEARREIEEEVSLLIDIKHLNFSHFIVDGTNPVGRVHLGLLAIYRLTKEETKEVERMVLEANVIESGRFETLDTLALDENFHRLENWSKAVVSTVKAEISGWINPDDSQYLLNKVPVTGLTTITELSRPKDVEMQLVNGSGLTVTMAQTTNSVNVATDIAPNSNGFLNIATTSVSVDLSHLSGGSGGVSLLTTAVKTLDLSKLKRTILPASESTPEKAYFELTDLVQFLATNGIPLINTKVVAEEGNQFLVGAGYFGRDDSGTFKEIPRGLVDQAKHEILYHAPGWPHNEDQAAGDTDFKLPG